MPAIVLPVPHVKQTASGECLAACAAMLLAYLGIFVTYNQLLILLKIKWFGTASSNVYQLEQLGVEVIFEMGDLAKLHHHLLNNQPCITFVKTGDLPYWPINLAHAVVVVGLDEQYIYLNDPEFENAPMQILRGDFELAWLEQDEFYAVIK